ncbi:N-acetylglucosaminyl-diphospho-decaprenol L-rhamnosyltransferase [Pelotomaculum schinkii]|uniref:N-acetylglucosaminyl-diphospho-decaprenol L-rhamnosyltransferase n=1 Tax=Pelotomaculum schinkii TaxID=78350 RepID=A0A4Y7R784_9FIRM|nr:glycosyltransferase family 2 protein [Pelotomaculum schinkii]TEB04613.1 N-acetylglucosaminyl-diphospho-decaprenol L-rhamnosyltransferase [Pelotomaculum schinkii]
MTTTVIIVNWNSGALLMECLRHLECQTRKPDRVLLVDNASSDNSVTGAEAFTNITIRRLNVNLGFAGGNNQALAECDTDFVALLNPDAFPDPDWLEHLLAAADKYPEAAAFGSRQSCFNNIENLDGTGDIYHMSGLVWRNRYGKQQQAEDLVPREIFSPCAAAALYRRQALVDIGGFDEDFFCYLEDVDLGFRLRLAGHKAIYVPEAVVHHVGSSASGEQRSVFSAYQGHRNLVWTFVKNMPGILFWLLLPLHLLLNLATIGSYITHGKADIILRAKKDAVKGLPRAWLKRKQIQTNRRTTIREIWRILDKRLIPSKFIR